MKAGGVIGSSGNGVKRGIQKTYRRPAGRKRLLVDQRGETGPQRRGATGAAKTAGTAIVVIHKHIVRRQRHVGNIAPDGGTGIGSHAHIGLPIGNFVIGADAAAGANIRIAAVVPIPDRLGGPRCAGSAHRQGCSAHGGDIGAVHRRGCLAGIIQCLAAGVGITVARGLKIRLSLRGHLFENTVNGCAGSAAPSPRSTQLLGQIVIGHAAQDGAGARPHLVNNHLRQSRCHGDCHFDVQSDFIVVARAGSAAADDDVFQRNITGHADGLLIVGDIHHVVAGKFQQPHRLPGAGERGARNVCVAKIVARVIAAGAGTGQRPSLRRRRGMQQRLRKRIIAQTLDRHHGQTGRHRGFAIRRKKVARLRRMPVGAQRDLKRAFNIRCAAFHVQHHAVRMDARHRQAVRLRKTDDRLIILFRRPEAFREFLRREIFMEVGAARIVKLPEQFIQRGLVPQRQADGEGKIRRRGQKPRGRQPRNHRRHVAAQKLPRRCLGGHRQAAEDRGGQARQEPPPLKFEKPPVNHAP